MLPGARERCEAGLQQLEDQLTLRAQTCADAAGRGRSTAWAAWVAKALEGGAKAAHLWSKEPCPWEPEPVQQEEGIAGFRDNPVDHLQLQRANWKSLWHAGNTG